MPDVLTHAKYNEKLAEMDAERKARARKVVTDLDPKKLEEFREMTAKEQDMGKVSPGDSGK